VPGISVTKGRILVRALFYGEAARIALLLVFFNNKKAG
jgi:hypothetical protein